MITNFENLTGELTDVEKTQVMPYVSKLINKSSKSNPITNSVMLKLVRANGFKSDSIRIRKIIHNLRLQSEFPIVASSKGYYITKDLTELERYIKSLNDRLVSIAAINKTMINKYREFKC